MLDSTGKLLRIIYNKLLIQKEIVISGNTVTVEVYKEPAVKLYAPDGHLGQFPVNMRYRRQTQTIGIHFY